MLLNVQIPRAEVVLASYENMTSDFSEVPWSLTILDCRGGSKGSIARMVSMLSRVEAMHLMVATHLPDTPGGLTSMLKFMNAQPEVRAVQENRVKLRNND